MNIELTELDKGVIVEALQLLGKSQKNAFIFLELMNKLNAEPQYITDDAIKDAPTGLYRADVKGETPNSLCSVFINGDCGISLMVVSSGEWWPINSHKILKLEPLYLDEPVKPKAVPVVGEWYWVKLARDNAYTPKKCFEYEGELIFSYACSLSATYAWDETPIERPQ